MQQVVQNRTVLWVAALMTVLMICLAPRAAQAYDVLPNGAGTVFCGHGGVIYKNNGYDAFRWVRHYDGGYYHKHVWAHYRYSNGSYKWLHRDVVTCYRVSWA